MKKCLVIALSLIFSAITYADVKMPAIFGDHMVLQQDAKIPVWGSAEPGEEVTVSFAGQTAKAKADDKGDWRVDLDKLPMNANPQTLTVQGKNKVEFSDVLVGDVWICSGQSNMGVQFGETHRFKEDVATSEDSLLRLFHVSQKSDLNPQKDVALRNNKQWEVAKPGTVDTFTAVGYYFGRELRKNLGNKPIGLIRSTYGGTMIQAWISLSGMEKNVDADPEIKEMLEKRAKRVSEYSRRLAEYASLKQKYEADIKRWWKEVNNAPDYVAKVKAWEVENQKAVAEGKPRPHRPKPAEPKPKEPESPDGGRAAQEYMAGIFYNGMIAPIVPYAIKGVIWYQGESNSKNGKLYRVLFPMMIKDWREKWGQGDFPFLFVQLPNIGKPQTEPVQPEDNCPLIREAQLKALELPNTGMAIIIDVGDPDDVHGKDKYDVGTRLSLVARKLVYGQDVVGSGPLYKSMKVEGNKIRISFDYVGSGLIIDTTPWTPSGKIPPVAKELKGFAIAGADKKWVWAKAEIEGNDVVVSSPEVAAPVAVRYGWANVPPCNLYNKEKLPASPFRTDTWE